MSRFDKTNRASSKKDDDALSLAVKNVFHDIKDEFLQNSQIPSNWDIVMTEKSIKYSAIKTEMLKHNFSPNLANKYYGGPSSIVSDAPIVYLNVYKNPDAFCSETEIEQKPLFIGEIKKQGTNDIRMAEGKKKQQVGNAAPDRVAKNFGIAADYCYLCDREFFPYNVFLHGCDFGADITETTKAKLKYLFGTLNKFNPFFDKDIAMAGLNLKGGTCYYQKEEFSQEQLYSAVYRCISAGLDYYLAKNKE